MAAIKKGFELTNKFEMNSTKKLGKSVPNLNFLKYKNKNRPSFYAVGHGRETGVYSNWKECKDQVWWFSNARFKKFDSCKEAEKFVEFWQGHSFVKNPNKKKDGKKATKKTKKEENAENEEETVQEGFLYDKNNFVEVYTDASVLNNGTSDAMVGLGVWFGKNHALNISKAVSNISSSNAGEIEAARLAIQSAKKAGIEKLKIFTDSSFLLNSMTKWIYFWKKNGWVSKSLGPIKQQKEFEKLLKEMKNIDVRWEKVAGHTGNVGNESAHKLAYQGITKFKVEDQTNDQFSVKDENNKPEPTPIVEKTMNLKNFFLKKFKTD